MSPQSLTNFEIQNFYQNEHKFDGEIKDELQIKDGVYVMNLDKLKSIGTHWIALYVNGDNWSASYNATYVDCFEEI